MWYLHTVPVDRLGSAMWNTWWQGGYIQVACMDPSQIYFMLHVNFNFKNLIFQYLFISLVVVIFLFLIYEIILQLTWQPWIEKINNEIKFNSF